jgi:hypothetical protein
MIWTDATQERGLAEARSQGSATSRAGAPWRIGRSHRQPSFEAAAAQGAGGAGTARSRGWGHVVHYPRRPPHSRRRPGRTLSCEARASAKGAQPIELGGVV